MMKLTASLLTAAAVLSACTQTGYATRSTNAAFLTKGDQYRYENSRLNALIEASNQIGGFEVSDRDVALFNTLTPEQQRRAIEFVAAGSTIQSSLQPDR